MKRVVRFFLLLTLVVLTSLHLPSASLAFFSKNQNNPILGVGTTGQWDSSSITDPNVIIDISTYKMWYTGTTGGFNNHIGLATSTNGLTWEKNISNPVFSKDISDPTELEVGLPKVIKIGNEYKMWYLSTAPYTGPGNEVYRIKLATSPNGIDSWVKHGLVFRRSSATWESEGVVPNTVLFKDNEYKMWYSARNSTGIWQIGYAESNDGITWSRQPNPVLNATQSWEGTTVAAASVFFQDGSYHMYYHSGPVVPHFIGHATSTDGINWIKDPNPVLERGNCFAGEFDCNMIAAPSVIQVANKLKMYYAGHDGNNWQIGYAEEPLSTVPYYSQTDPIWGGNIYDTATAWANPGSQTIGSLGCALTSATMVLRSFNVTQTPGNPNTGLPAKDLNPGTLNEWLTSINDGHFRNGETNFAALANMTRLIHDQNPASQKLLYRRGVASPDVAFANGVPAILKLNYPPSPSDAHFVVATNTTNSTYQILDPLYADRTTLAPHYSTITRTDYFEPTNSDFSYLIFAVDPTVMLTLKNELGEEVGTQSVEAPIVDGLNNISSGAAPLRLLFYMQPPEDQYTLEIDAPNDQSYQLDTYTYNRDGMGNMQSIHGIVGPANQDTVIVETNPLEPPTSPQEEVTFDSVRNDVESLYQLGWISHKLLYAHLNSGLDQAEDFYRKNQIQRTAKFITHLITKLTSLNGTMINEQGFQILSSQLHLLLQSLQ